MDVALATAASAPKKGRAARPGPSGVRSALIVVLVVLVGFLAYGVYGMVDRPHVNLSDPQSWLPKQQLDHPVDRIYVGTAAHPALTVEGDFVKVKTPTFTALALVNGPVVPGEGLPVRQSYTTCTWTVSISHVTGTVPISVADFDSIDHFQTVFKPYLMAGQAPLPATITTGRRLTFKIQAVMPVGEGLLRWAPDGNNIVAKWDYQVEND